MRFLVAKMWKRKMEFVITLICTASVHKMFTYHKTPNVHMWRVRHPQQIFRKLNCAIVLFQCQYGAQDIKCTATLMRMIQNKNAGTCLACAHTRTFIQPKQMLFIFVFEITWIWFLSVYSIDERKLMHSTLIVFDAAHASQWWWWW